MDAAVPTRRAESPEERAGLLSRLLFLWPSPIFRVASKSSLEHADLWTLPRTDQAAIVTERFTACWERAEAGVRAERAESPKAAAATPLSTQERERVFTRAMIGFLGPRFWLHAPLVKGLNSTLQFAFPVLLSGCVAFIEGSAPLGFLPLTPAVGFSLCALLGVLMALKAIAENAYFHLVSRAAWQVRAAVTTAVFSKSLRLSAAARQQRTLGEMVNLMQLDATKLEGFVMQAHVLWDGIYQIAGYLALLSTLIGGASAVGLAVMLCMMPVQLRIMKATGVAEGRATTHSDARVRAVNEALQSMASVKMHA